MAAIDKLRLFVHTVAVAEERDFSRRVFVEDLRRDGTFLRVTWHREHSAFVVSHWDREVCVAATRVAAEDVAPVVGLLANGLTDALVAAEAKPNAALGSPEHWWQRLRRRVSRRSTPDRSVADVVAFPRHRDENAEHQPRWKAHG